MVRLWKYVEKLNLLNKMIAPRRAKTTSRTKLEKVGHLRAVLI